MLLHDLTIIVLVYFCTTVMAVDMQQLCARASAIQREDHRRFACVIDLIYRDQIGAYNEYDISMYDPLVVFTSMQLTTGHSFQNLVTIFRFLP